MSEYKSVVEQRTKWVHLMNAHNEDDFYGYEWGHPEHAEARSKNGYVLGNYLKIKQEILLPNIVDRVVIDLGSLAGKWTQFMTTAKKVICVDLNEASYEYLCQRVKNISDLSFYLTSGDELKGIPDKSIDFVFSMDTLVRSERPIIESYIGELARILSPIGRACIHLPCTDQRLSYELGFTPLRIEEIRKMVDGVGIYGCDIDQQTISHGVLVRIDC